MMMPYYEYNALMILLLVVKKHHVNVKLLKTLSQAMKMIPPLDPYSVMANDVFYIGHCNGTPPYFELYHTSCGAVGVNISTRVCQTLINLWNIRAGNSTQESLLYGYREAGMFILIIFCIE